MKPISENVYKIYSVTLDGIIKELSSEIITKYEYDENNKLWKLYNESGAVVLEIIDELNYKYYFREKYDYKSIFNDYFEYNDWLYLQMR